MNITRNEKCMCGSNIKTKDCCKLEKIEEREFHDLIMKYSKDSLEPDEAILLKSIEMLELYLKYKDLRDDSRLNIISNLIGAYQRRGLHTKALEYIEELKKLQSAKDNESKIYVTVLEASSYCAFQSFSHAASIIDSICMKLLSATDNLSGYAFYLLEAGKIYFYADRILDAKKCLEKCIALLVDNDKELETTIRAESNLAKVMLLDNDPAMVQKGVELLYSSLERKSAIGDLVGISNDYSNLGIHYHIQKNYKSALAYYRKDLWLSRKIGNLHALEISLRNLSSIYIEAKQFKKARNLILESLRVGKTINDETIITTGNRHLKLARDKARVTAESNELIGPQAPCICGSEKTFEDCCGIADHDPIDLPFRIAGNSEFLETENYKFSKRTGEVNKLDFIFKDSENASRRLSWVTYEFKKGWYEMYELPDMANSYLLSAKRILKSLDEDTTSTEEPLSCLIMSVCALEAFINQVTYFFYDVRKNNAQFELGIPIEFSMDVLEFQKGIELTNKWDLLGKAICRDKWNPTNVMWNDFKNIIYIRNEFVHFKLSSYERVIPVPKEQHVIFKKIPRSVKIRDVYHSWPTKILTYSFAKWCVKTTDDMIKYFKEQYDK